MRCLVIASKPPTAEEIVALPDTSGCSAAETLVVFGGAPRHFSHEGFEQFEVHALTPAAAAHGPAFRRQLRAARGPGRLWVYLSHDERVAAEAARCEVVIALDRPAAAPAAQLVARFPHLRLHSPVPDALEGMSPATADSPVAATRDAPESELLETVRRRMRDLVRAGHQHEAEVVVEDALDAVQKPRDRADLLGDLVNAQLGVGHTPRLLLPTVTAELAIADRHLAAGRPAKAAEGWGEAMRVVFHRAAHLDGLQSPLARTPREFIEPVIRSAVAGRLAAPKGRAGMPSAQATQPRRVLLATWANANFLGELREYLETQAGVEVRFIDLAGIPELRRYSGDPTAIAQQVLAGRPELTDLVHTHLGAHVEWADVVFVDWCTVAAVFMTLLDPRDTRIVVRLHSVEAFTLWPQLVDFSRVDDLVFVSEHLKDLVVATVPALSRGDGPALHVLPLALDLQRFVRPKRVGAHAGGSGAGDPRFTLGLIGWSAVAKDPLWALEVVRQLRRHDQRYRLLLFGSDFVDSASAAAREYGTRLHPTLEELERDGAVERRGHTDDVPAALQEIGVILSSSVREGCHTAVMEGAASGAVPVVRDWPYFAGKPNGPRTLYPPSWVVNTPDEAVERVRRTTAAEESWLLEGRNAAREAFDRWGWSNVRPGYDRLLGLP